MTDSAPVAKAVDLKDDFTFLFLDVLTSPSLTMQAIMEPGVSYRGKRLIAKTLLLVLLTSLISGLASTQAQSTTTAILIALGSIIGGAINWLAMSWIMHVIANWVSKNHVTFDSCMVASGWASLPLIFDAPLSCFRAFLGHYYLIALCLVALWSAYILWLAFKEAMQLSTLNAILLFVFGPPLLFVGSMFWLFIIMVVLADCTVG